MSTFNELCKSVGYEPSRGIHPFSRVERVFEHDLKGLYFVHAQKTGGHSVQRTSLNSRGLSWTNHDHAGRLFERTAAINEEEDSSDRKILYGHVRNPYDWLTSFYHHGSSGVGYVAESVCFKEFILNACSPDEKKVPKFFRYKRINRHQRWPLRYLQTWQSFDLFDESGPKYSRAEFYIRFEKMTEAYQHMFGEKLPHSNKSRRKQKNWRSLWDNEMIDAVSRFRAQELKLLGYNFDGPIDDSFAIKINEPFMWKL